MEIRRELLLTLGVLVLLNLALAFGTTGLLVRMGPAIERILDENVYTIVAVEDMLAEFAAAGGTQLSPDVQQRVREALARAEQNVTEAGERPLLAKLEQCLEDAMAGDALARLEFIATARRLIGINRDAMRYVAAEARRLGGAGAWAAVFIGFVSFLLSLFVVARLQRRLVRPLIELYEVLESARGGARLRRCSLPEAPREVVRVSEAVNGLLDERLQHSGPHDCSTGRSARGAST